VMDAEVYDVSGNGSFCLGLVNFKYDESETAALSANGNSVKASLLIEETSTASKTASFNLSVTVGDDSTPTTAADLAENFVLIKGNFNGMAGFIANMPPEEDMLELGADYIVEESTITLLTNLDSSVFEFCIYYLSESGMKLHLSVPEGEDKIKLMTPTATIQYEESVNIDGSVDATFTFVEEPTQISKGERTENVSISNIYLKNIPGFETLSAVNIVTSITYGSIFLMDAGLLSLASGEGVSLSDLIGMMDSLSAQIGMYASIGFQNTNGGTTFEVLDTYLTDGNKSLVLIILSDELTKTVNFGLQMIEEVDPLAYTLSTDSTTGETYYSVTGMRAQVDSFKVPATYQGIPVKEIAAETFKNSEITAVDLSGASNLTTIGDSAFSYCQNLETVITSDSITTIGEEAFYDCKSLLSITMPEYVTTISEFAFSGCESLLSIAIPENVTTIENHAFSRCKGLTEINYNATNLTTAISTNGACLFSYAGHQAEDGITVNIGANVLNIPSGLFYDNSYLSSANIKRVIFKEGSLCESIGDSSFSGCIYLTSINIPDSVTSIGMNAFSTCVRLQNITIPESVTSIGNYALFNFYALAEVYNLSALNIVKGEFTFGCVANYAKVVYTSLDAETRIIEENGVKYYKYEDAKIALCTTNKNFTTISLADDCTQINQGAFYYCSNLESITIPEEVTGIGEHAFYWCSSLADIIIPESVTSIGSHSFLYCK
ncbi:MAG: leucine-rich repeat domain-containing protein, partial [Clostridia bacterium]|nr:leucine-rich repeat domain-containing protein [Clostridia bacterium]